MTYRCLMAAVKMQGNKIDQLRIYFEVCLHLAKGGNNFGCRKRFSIRAMLGECLIGEVFMGENILKKSMGSGQRVQKVDVMAGNRDFDLLFPETLYYSLVDCSLCRDKIFNLYPWLDCQGDR